MTITEQVEACRRGEHPRLVARMPSGWAVMSESQFLAGYCMLLADPVVPSLNDLDESARRRFLQDMTLLGDAVLDAVEPAPERINYEMLGNVDPTLHAHVVPRGHTEDPKLRPKPVWLYPPQVWNDPASAYDESAHGGLRAEIARRLQRASRHRPGKGTLSPAWQDAVSFAARAHLGHLRHDERTPYIAHPFRVALAVRDLFGCEDETTLTAALLHDTIEDTRTDFDEIEERFGADVARLVAALSKDMRLPEPEREPAYDAALAAAGWRAHLIKLADQFDNLTETDPESKKKTRKAIDRAGRALAIAEASIAERPEAARAAAMLQRLIELRRKQAGMD